ncbi:hypothetical protein KVR01_001046 [Diaporthe batatas]|uniref:uncharacterized protein n=1 Tax=Diaporthe batatas TaxID=748121 RepID=UPI001D045EB7|nr:uncharacterized protein KVR01_001046 [Diaporthe batatas]KAG8170301.1 hypothetical protein KVR01_001046 [Diaporthe batatas]
MHVLETLSPFIGLSGGWQIRKHAPGSATSHQHTGQYKRDRQTVLTGSCRAPSPRQCHESCLLPLPLPVLLPPGGQVNSRTLRDSDDCSLSGRATITIRAVQAGHLDRDLTKLRRSMTRGLAQQGDHLF